MKRKFGTPTLVTLCTLSIAITLAGTIGVFLCRFGGQERFTAALKYSEFSGVIENYYVGDIDKEAMESAAYDAMIASLEDRWSYYMTAEAYESYKQYTENSYAGIGVTISPDEATGGLLVTAVTKDSPAEQVGVQVGEIMVAVDGESILGMSTSEVKAIIQPKLGGELTLTLQDESGARRELAVNCEIIYADPVEYELLEDNIGYIRITNFENGSGSGAVAAVDDLVSQGAESLIFDVRSNPGGKVTQLLEILDYLLPEGDLFITRNKEGEEKVETSGAECIEMPVAVLVNAGSYSAAEFFAAALSEYGWAVVVGEQTTGKGRSQVTIELSDGSAVHISNNVYLTPNRIDLSEEGGVTPDIQVEQQSEGDAQLEAALQLMR